MFLFNCERIKDDFYIITAPMGVRSFLFIGDERAMVVDTTMDKGLCDFVKTITKKSAFVVSTHADMDHVGSDGEFSEQYMHPAEFDHYAGKRPLPAGIIPIWEGDIIDLGTYKFEVIFTPGHTPGGIMLLERDKRFLIGGDNIQRDGAIYMFGGGRNFAAYIATMEKLKEYIPLIDTVYASHNRLEVAPETINDLKAAAEDYLGGRLLSREVQDKPEGVRCFYKDDISFFAY